MTGGDSWTGVEMADAVEALLALRDVDREIDRLREELEEMMPELRGAEERLEELRGEVEEARRRMEEIEEEHRGHRRAVQAGRATLKRLQERAETVQDMRQHRAVQSELQTARENLDESEDQALDSMARLERARETLEELEEELAELTSEYEERAGELEDRREEIEAELEAYRKRRRGRAERLDSSTMELYEQVRRGRTDEVLAPVDGGHCGHCYTMIPKQRQSEIRSGRKLHRCEGCGVILHPRVSEE